MAGWLTIQNGVAAIVSLVITIFMLPIILPIVNLILGMMGLGALNTIMTMVTWLIVFYTLFVVTVGKLTDARPLEGN